MRPLCPSTHKAKNSQRPPIVLTRAAALKEMTMINSDTDFRGDAGVEVGCKVASSQSGPGKEAKVLKIEYTVQD